ncbi:MAG: hypothetical protein KF684_10145 [Phycisphaeraceae bacterium]|nr:hypothetical protein [Phycisphaeraceae bacterium]
MRRNQPDSPRARIGSIWAKLACAVVGAAMIASGLLAVRQQRIQIASELMRTHLEAEQSIQNAQRLRAEIAQRLAINHLRQLASAEGDFVPATPPREAAQP